MIVAGLTGSIGMGKSLAASVFRTMGVPVHDSDEAARELTAPGGQAVSAVAAEFSGTFNKKSGGIDREKLREIVFADERRRRDLEAIIHPMVQSAQGAFLKAQRRRGARLAVLDIPLLFETGAQRRVDCVICVSAPFLIQRQRVLARPGMTEDIFEKILEAQMPDSSKRGLADFVVETGLGRAYTGTQLKRIVRQLTGP